MYVSQDVIVPRRGRILDVTMSLRVFSCLHREGRRRGDGVIHLDQNRGRLNVVLVHHDRIVVVDVLVGARLLVRVVVCYGMYRKKQEEGGGKVCEMMQCIV